MSLSSNGFLHQRLPLLLFYQARNKQDVLQAKRILRYGMVEFHIHCCQHTQLSSLRSHTSYIHPHWRNDKSLFYYKQKDYPFYSRQ